MEPILWESRVGGFRFNTLTSLIKDQGLCHDIPLPEPSQFYLKEMRRVRCGGA